MLTEFRGLTILLLAGVAGQSVWVEALVGRHHPGWTAGLVFIIGTMVMVVVGQSMGVDASQTRWRRIGWWVVICGATLHLLFDAACCAMPVRSVKHPWMLLSGVMVAALVMSIQLVLAVFGLRHPEARPPDFISAKPRGVAGMLVQQVSLFGGNAIALVAISLGLVAMVIVVMFLHGVDGRSLLIGGLFLLGSLAGVGMGLGRRAALLGAPWGGLLRRWSRARYLATREGIVLVTRRYTVLYRWPAVLGNGIGEVSGNPSVMVTLQSGYPGELLRSPAQAPEEKERWQQRQLKSRALVNALYGSDLAIFSIQTLAGPGPLNQQIAAAISDPATTQTLPPAADFV
jgi:hypothetical protein